MVSLDCNFRKGLYNLYQRTLQWLPVIGIVSHLNEKISLGQTAVQMSHISICKSIHELLNVFEGFTIVSATSQLILQNHFCQCEGSVI